MCTGNVCGKMPWSPIVPHDYTIMPCAGDKDKSQKDYVLLTEYSAVVTPNMLNVKDNDDYEQDATRSWTTHLHYWSVPELARYRPEHNFFTYIVLFGYK